MTKKCAGFSLRGLAASLSIAETEAEVNDDARP